MALSITAKWSGSLLVWICQEKCSKTTLCWSDQSNLACLEQTPTDCCGRSCQPGINHVLHCHHRTQALGYKKLKTIYLLFTNTPRIFASTFALDAEHPLRTDLNSLWHQVLWWQMRARWIKHRVLQVPFLIKLMCSLVMLLTNVIYKERAHLQDYQKA